ncbi:MAG: disulfide bond formation protein B [Burkholderiales bacterium]|nr:disulfide bond formation protein B [Burkholderiales bacterium]
MNPTDLFPSRRFAYAFGFLVCAALMAYALYLQYVQLLEPCPMCWFQRVALVLLGGVFLVAALVNPSRRGARRTAWGALLAGGAGAFLAARHLYIQSMPSDQLPSCGMGITYMLETLPFLDVFARALKGSVECNKIDLILGLPIPAWNLLFFVAAVAAAFLLINHRAHKVHTP